MAVYFMAGAGHVKIGHGAPWTRWRQQQTGSPVLLSFLGYVGELNGSSEEMLEQRLHHVLRHHRLHGEWFDEKLHNSIQYALDLGVEIRMVADALLSTGKIDMEEFSRIGYELRESARRSNGRRHTGCCGIGCPCPYPGHGYELCTCEVYIYRQEQIAARVPEAQVDEESRKMLQKICAKIRFPG